MKTTIQNLAVLILLVSTMNVYSQEYDNRGVRKDYTRPIAGLYYPRDSMGMQFMEYRLIRRGKQYYRLVIFQ